MISLDDYYYDLPPELIAHQAVNPRDRARLFVYNTATDTVTYDVFANIATYVSPALLVLNETKVVPARLRATYASGESIELFLLFDRGVIDGRYVEALVNHYVQVGETLSVGSYHFVVIDNTRKQMLLEPQFPIRELETLLQNTGTTPLPPYLHANASEEELRARYQSIFATTPGSVAAPTASLHFTEQVFDALHDAGCTTTRIRLNVGLGTFAPIFPEDVIAKKLHHERYYVPHDAAAAIVDARARGKNVLAVGTTVVRTLESARDAIIRGESVEGDTDLFIYPPYTFTVPDMLLTNFHVPRSSLMCLVDAFLQHKGARQNLVTLYQTAIHERFRFYSFGDAMLIV